MKKIIITLFLVTSVCSVTYSSGNAESESETADRAIVQDQQIHYQKIHPLPFFDYSISRDVYIQIYEFVTTKAYVTYTVIESMTGVTFYHGTSIGYGIPADTSLSNPVQAQWYRYSGVSGIAIEQAEPNGLFSSKNTDGTWVLFIQSDGSITPIYTEHKVTTFPFKVRQTDSGVWVRADNEPVDFTIKINK